MGVRSVPGVCVLHLGLVHDLVLVIDLLEVMLDVGVQESVPGIGVLGFVLGFSMLNLVPGVRVLDFVRNRACRSRPGVHARIHGAGLCARCLRTEVWS